jgi:hypothetical protein
VLTSAVPLTTRLWTVVLWTVVLWLGVRTRPRPP